MADSDYRKIAADAKTEHEKREAEKDAEWQKERTEREEYVAKAVLVLTDAVIPELEKAATSFREEGIDSSIENTLDVANMRIDPFVKFQCLGPKRADDWQLKAPPVFISSNGDRLTLSVSEHEFSKHPEKAVAAENVGNYGEIVRQAVETALEAYYEKLRQSPFSA